MKKLILLFAFLGVLTTNGAQAQTNGTTGPLQWEITNGTLTITGNGAMPDYNYVASPWYNQQVSISGVIISDGVTSIGSSAFSD